MCGNDSRSIKPLAKLLAQNDFYIFNHLLRYIPSISNWLLDPFNGYSTNSIHTILSFNNKNTGPISISIVYYNFSIRIDSSLSFKEDKIKILALKIKNLQEFGLSGSINRKNLVHMIEIKSEKIRV